MKNKALKLALLLLMSNGSLLIADMHSKEFLTAWCMARRGDQGPLLNLIKSDGIISADPSETEDGNITHMAARYGLSTIMNELLRTKDINLNTQNLSGKTPLILAIDAKKEDIALALAKDPRVALNIQDKHGSTALHYAASRGLTPVVKALLKRDSHVKITDQRGLTAFDVARNEEIKGILLAKGAIPKIARTKLSASDDPGETSVAAQRRQRPSPLRRELSPPYM